MPDGLTMHVPRAWTDADGEAAPSHHYHDAAVFSVGAIRKLIELIEALRRRSAG